jgi:hypothetical protein
MYYSGPGIAYGIDQTFEVESSLSINFATGLQSWNGSSFDDAGSTELQYYRGGSSGASGQLIAPSASIVTSDSSVSSLLSFAPIATGYDAEAHSSARLRFLGDGTTTAEGSGPQIGTIASEPADGVYLASFVLSSDEAGLADSAPYSFVMHKGVLWSEVAAAVGSLNVPKTEVQVLGVPEPSTVLMTSLGMLSIFVRRRNLA